MLSTVSPHKALEFFEARLEFQMGPLDLKRAIDNREVNVIDVRSEEDYQKGHIPCAFNLPYERWDSFEHLTHDKPNVIYCYSTTCFLATRACSRFAEADYPVMELFGGFEEWENHKLPIEK